MPWNDTADLSFRWCYHLADALSFLGVHHAFISPGSRSTPLTFALTHHPRFHCHSVLDERCASYMALGAGKQSGVPALFVCTSGTAAANALPAVIEARMSDTPLLVLTADRPALQRGTGAPQTIDQIKLFGDYPVLFFDTGEPVDAPDDFNRLSRLGFQAFHDAVEKGGPVHLNMPFRKPLEPSPKSVAKVIEAYSVEEQSPSSASVAAEPEHRLPINLRHSTRPAPLSDTFQSIICQSRRPVAVVGPGTPFCQPFFEFLKDSGVTILCETGGIGGGITQHPLLFSNSEIAKNIADPDLVIRTGSTPVHAATSEQLLAWKVPQIVIGKQPQECDASLTATHILAGTLDEYDWNRITPMLEESSPSDVSHQRNAYRKSWEDNITMVNKRLEVSLNEEKQLTDPHVYHQLLPLIEQEQIAHVLLSNSYPIRDYLLYGNPDKVSAFKTLTNRGASGIDGITSTAIGSALAAMNSRSPKDHYTDIPSDSDSQKPAVLLTGDLAFLHDASALNNLRKRKVPLKIVVINNHGGSLFRMLPFHEHNQRYSDFVETPQEATISSLAHAHNLPYERAETIKELSQAWRRLSSETVGVLECCTDADASMNIRRNAHL